MAYRNSKTERRHTAKRENYAYIQGNTARKLNVAEEIQQPSASKQLSHSTRRNRERALYMNLGNVLFLAAALTCAAFVLMSYIRIQADITVCLENIAKLESTLNDMKLSNDEEYNRAVCSVDLEEIRRVAIGELGMRYAKEGQIINVSGEGSDYVRQLAEIE